MLNISISLATPKSSQQVVIQWLMKPTRLCCSSVAFLVHHLHPPPPIIYRSQTTIRTARPLEWKVIFATDWSLLRRLLWKNWLLTDTNNKMASSDWISWTGRAALCPANTRRWPNIGLMLGQRRRRWPNINPTLEPGSLVTLLHNAAPA